MVKIGVYLRKLSQNKNRGTAFLDHTVICQTPPVCKNTSESLGHIHSHTN